LPEIVYVTLRYVFLGLLYLVVFLVARLVYRELRPAPARQPAAPPRRERLGRKPSLVALDERGRKTRLDAFVEDQVILGRGPECGVEPKYTRQGVGITWRTWGAPMEHMSTVAASITRRNSETATASRSGGLS
jgi:hypothetical protein